MTHPRTAQPDLTIHELLARRWSPYAYADSSISGSELLSLFEAARWAASSYNEQPWSFLVARKEDSEEFERMLSCLVPPNQEWAKHAAVLVLTVISERFTRNEKPNRVALHDLGLAVGNLSFEATQRGIAVHQMAGILSERAQELYHVPEHHSVATGIALGHAAKLEELPEDVRARESAPRKRKALSELVFSGRHGQGADWLRS